jgi:hypothetical protein
LTTYTVKLNALAGLVCAFTAKREAAARGNIEELRGGRKIVEIHVAAEAARRCQRDLANEILFAAGVDPAPREHVVSWQRRCGNRTGSLPGQ